MRKSKISSPHPQKLDTVTIIRKKQKTEIFFVFKGTLTNVQILGHKHISFYCKQAKELNLTFHWDSFLISTHKFLLFVVCVIFGFNPWAFVFSLLTSCFLLSIFLRSQKTKTYFIFHEFVSSFFQRRNRKRILA